MDPLEERKRQRWLMLSKIYELLEGTDELRAVDPKEVGAELGFDQATASRTSSYLEKEGLIELHGLVGYASLTHVGVKEVETAMERPELPTRHFPVEVRVAEADTQVPVGKQSTEQLTMNVPKKVFLVHGQDVATKTQVQLWLTRMGIEVTVLHEMANGGRTLIEKFEEYAQQADAAIVLLTADDLGRHKDASVTDDEWRARQNVVFELGFFIGRLTRHRVVALFQRTVTPPSDFHGVVYVALDNDWKNELGRELRHMGFVVDMNRSV